MCYELEIILGLQTVSARVVWLIICTESLCHTSQDKPSTSHLSFDVSEWGPGGAEEVQRKTAEVWGRKGWNSTAVWRKGSWAGIWVSSASSQRCWVKGQSYPQYYNKYSNTRAASWGDSWAEALLPRVLCLGTWQHQGGKQASQDILWFCDTITDWPTLGLVWKIHVRSHIPARGLGLLHGFFGTHTGAGLSNIIKSARMSRILLLLLLGGKNFTKAVNLI